MRIFFATTVKIDRKGYVLRNIDDADGINSAAYGGAGLFDIGDCICPVSGEYQERTYRSGQGRSLWKSASKVRTAEQALSFYKSFGPIWPSLDAYVNGATIPAWRMADVLKWHKTLRNISERKESYMGWVHPGKIDDPSVYLKDRLLGSNAEIFLDKSGPHGEITIQIQMPWQFALIEMLTEIGVTRRTIESQRTCGYCGSPFTAGGGRGGSKRIDAKYCSPSCTQAASRQRRKILAGVLPSDQ